MGIQEVQQDPLKSHHNLWIRQRQKQAGTEGLSQDKGYRVWLTDSQAMFDCYALGTESEQVEHGEFLCIK